jgi:hypothetical protein
MPARSLTTTKAESQRLGTQIQREGMLALKRSSFVRRNVNLFGLRHELPASATIATRVAKPGTVQPRSTIVTIGEAPDGFGKQVLWHPADAGLALLVYLNTGDYMGVMISGVRATDSIQIINADGLGSFAEERGAYFLQRDRRIAVARVDGDIVIGPWDGYFADNFGFYRLHVLVKRGSGTFPEKIVD